MSRSFKVKCFTVARKLIGILPSPLKVPKICQPKLSKIDGSGYSNCRLIFKLEKENLKTTDVCIIKLTAVGTQNYTPHKNIQ